jgi:hypothetical protein
LFLQEAGIDCRTLTVRRIKNLMGAYSEVYESNQRQTKASCGWAGLTLKAEEMQAKRLKLSHGGYRL